MKTNLKIVLAALCCMGFVACSDDDEPKVNPDAPTSAEGVFILNQGTYGLQIEGSLTLIDYQSNTATQDVFLKANGRSLGATPQGAVVYGNKIYVGVYESNVIEIMDRNTYKSLRQISLSKAEGQSPRSLVAKDGKVYISMYNGYVSRLDTLTLAIDNTVKVGPNPEIMAIKGNKLYVPNSDGLNWQVGYGTTASVIDLATFAVEKTLTVGLNPAEFATNGSDLFVLCKGNYGDVPSMVYQVKENGEIEAVAQCTHYAVKGNKLYYVNAPWDATEFEYTIYDINTKAKSNMLADKGVDSPAGLGIDPINGNIIITSYNLDNGYASYVTPGYAKVYDSAGKLLGKYDAGVGPCMVFFNYK